MMLDWYWWLLIALAAVGGLGLLIGLYKREWLRQWAATRWLEPYIWGAIVFAYRASEKMLDAGLERLHGVDKKKIADAAYAHLPTSVRVFGLSLPLKQWLTEEKWAEMVETVLVRAFDIGDDYLEDLDALIEQRIKELGAQ